jgi:hypothetical protein
MELEDFISAVFFLTFQHFISGFLCVLIEKFNTRAIVWVVHTTGHFGSTTLATAKTPWWRHPWRPETCRRKFYASVIYTVASSACKVGFMSWLLGPFLNNPFLPTTGSSSGGWECLHVKCHDTPLLSAGPRSDASLVWKFPAHAMKVCTVLVVACVWIMSSAQQNVTTEQSSK